MKPFNTLTPHAHWLLRASLASVFVFHGALKLLNLEGFAQMLPISYTETVLVALAEFGGGLLILVGGFSHQRLFDLATRIGAAMQIPVMVGAIVLVHWGRWNFLPTQDFPMGGIEFQVTLALVALYLVITGNQVHRKDPASV
ncbi:MAG: DoxX family protein [gamma proteobacterium endosymbiont of Lamellibrachia anaximandri]|nr:DoxX family protein [gamma proteobacterium endosymbiont of Lamellibrachia anaximandri]MBL3535382.1 DoxX family protein [gamma proteobacterium endosymbiont of Lamellibrachia anaximandri]